ncbi:hypothetical protein HMPREF0762_01727 [Slackia exigua ATCC 700122]|uniref:Uncharacterized protein n=1 Tax=Slackia exigua (strain ATCC 700122 / DSM 15923 / CIP 105133 / JCM 11022 / KCTC 5966 / S-7) TaxID=649764 RepID=D0WIQ2_SLAES|nr:hypothetical protein HMPREF0762_01727 [Slackia exigua ATCC 700122]
MAGARVRAKALCARNSPGFVRLLAAPSVSCVKSVMKRFSAIKRWRRSCAVL